MVLFVKSLSLSLSLSLSVNPFLHTIFIFVVVYSVYCFHVVRSYVCQVLISALGGGGI